MSVTTRTCGDSQTHSTMNDWITTAGGDLTAGEPGSPLIELAEVHAKSGGFNEVLEVDGDFTTSSDSFPVVQATDAARGDGSQDNLGVVMAYDGTSYIAAGGTRIALSLMDEYVVWDGVGVDLSQGTADRISNNLMGVWLNSANNQGTGIRLSRCVVKAPGYPTTGSGLGIRFWPTGTPTQVMHHCVVYGGYAESKLMTANVGSATGYALHLFADGNNSSSTGIESQAGSGGSMYLYNCASGRNSNDFVYYEASSGLETYSCASEDGTADDHDTSGRGHIINQTWNSSLITDPTWGTVDPHVPSGSNLENAGTDPGTDSLHGASWPAHASGDGYSGDLAPWHLDFDGDSHVSESTESIGCDAVAGGATYQNSITEGAKAGDSYSEDYTAAGTVTEGAKAGETLTSALTALGSFLDGADAGDTYAGLLTTAQSILEGAEAGDSWAGIKLILGDVTEGAKAGEAYTALLTLALAVSEGAEAGDSYSSILSTLASWAEGATAGEQLAVAVLIAAAVSEGAKAGDSWAGVQFQAETWAEGALGSDSWSSLLTAVAAQAGGTKAGDSMAVAALLSSTMLEGAEAGDSWDGTVIGAFQGAITEGATAGEAWAAVWLAAVAFSEGALAGDTLVSVLGAIASWAEGALAGDQFAAGLRLLSSWSEGATAGDAWAGVVTQFLEGLKIVPVTLTLEDVESITLTLEGTAGLILTLEDTEGIALPLPG